MTSKDNLEFILKELCRHLDKSQQDDIIKKAIPIVKDLELLEILCNHLSAFLGTGEYGSKTQKIIILRGNIFENDKDFEKLKARLDFQEGENW